VGTGRLEAFSDGVLAIIITISVLELRPPHDTDLAALWSRHAIFFTYALSFAYVGIYWSNHHHLLHVTERVSGGILWAHLMLLFWLSLFPFAAGWMGGSGFAALPTAVYGVVLLLAGSAYYGLERTIIRSQGRESLLASAVGADRKGRLSIVLYAVSILLAFAAPLASNALFVIVAVIWLVPDRRIERTVGTRERSGDGSV
jgi:uncharacterized membrane protein